MDLKTRTDNRPDILFVLGSLGIGGTELHLIALSQALVSRGWRVLVYSFGARGPALELFRAGGIEVITPWLPDISRKPASRIFLGLSATIHLFKVMVQLRPEIVHFFLPASYLIGAPLAIFSRMKIRIMSRRSLNLYQKINFLVGPIERILHPFMTAILGNSAKVVDELEVEGVSRDKLGLIYNGIDVSAFSSKADRHKVRETFGIKGDALVLTIVANLIPYKGHLDLVEALALSARDMPVGWKLLIVGRDDGVGASMKALAEENLVFLGLRGDVAEILTASDIGLLVSHQEGFSNAVLEGMSAGLPMIVTDVGGNAEAVIDGKNGIVVPPRDPDALGRAIVALAGNQKKRVEYGANARARIEENFTMDRCIENYEAMYRGLLAGKIPRDIPELR